MSSSFDYSCDVCSVPTFAPGLCEQCGSQTRSITKYSSSDIPNPIRCLNCGMPTPFAGFICHHCQAPKEDSKRHHLQAMDLLLTEHLQRQEQRAEFNERQRKHNAKVTMATILVMIKIGLIGFVFVAALIMFLAFVPENPGLAVVCTIFTTAFAALLPRLAIWAIDHRQSISPSLIRWIVIAGTACISITASWIQTKSVIATFTIALLTVGVVVAIRFIMRMQLPVQRTEDDHKKRAFLPK
jgi:hypothetical protein